MRHRKDLNHLPVSIEEVDLGFELLAELRGMDDRVDYTSVMNRVSQDTLTGQSRSFAETHWPNLENERHTVHVDSICETASSSF
jgi:hypothetical protein